MPSAAKRGKRKEKQIVAERKRNRTNRRDYSCHLSRKKQKLIRKKEKKENNRTRNWCIFATQLRREEVGGWSPIVEPLQKKGGFIHVHIDAGGGGSASGERRGERLTCTGRQRFGGHSRKEAKRG